VVGEVTSTSAIVWGRCDRATTFHVQLDGRAEGPSTPVGPEQDFTGKVVLVPLTPASEQRYRAWCGRAESDALAGSFRTAPPAGDAAPVRFAWSGDVGGQNVCRDADKGYFMFDEMRRRSPEFFVALGDMIYADDACKETGLFHNRQVPGPGASDATAPSFWEHWRYNREDAASQRFLLSTSYYAVWDDHEISNDAGPQRDWLRGSPGDHRLPPAREAFVDYQPMVSTNELYRSVRWGKNVELFLLDTRSHRDANSQQDVGRTLKTMLGPQQREWLIKGLTHSDATWKVVVSSVPISIPTHGDDWAVERGRRGFHRELDSILAAAKDAKVENLVFLTTDVHFATGFRYEPSPGFHFLEFVCGPLNAGMFPKQDLDLSLKPKRLFFYGGPLPAQVTDFSQAWPFFNFGEIDIDAAGVMTLRIVNGEGKVVFEDRYRPQTN
jgi:alkaline phosphatase D